MKRKLLMFMCFGIFFFSVGLAVAADNRNVQRVDVADRFWPADSRHMVRFSTTTAAANTTFCISTMSVINLVYSTTSYTASYSPTIATSTGTTYGGRAYTTFQIITGASNVYVDLRAVDISTNTSPYVTQGNWWSPDDPISWQGEICMKSPSTFTATGWMWFDKPR